MKVINGKNEGEKYSLEMFMGTKTIHAGMISKQEYCDYKGWKVPDNEDPNEIGYLVAYSDDYVSWSPAVPFQEAYRTNGNLTFGHAIEAAKKGKRIAREGWNGKKMFVFIRPHDNIDITVLPNIKSLPQEVKDYMVQDFANGETHFASGNPIQVHFTPYFCLKDPQGNISNRWNASTPDILAEDWMIID